MFNQFILVGRVVRDHEMKELPSGSKVLNFSIAQNKKWTDSDGVINEKPIYFDLTAFGKIAEILSQYTGKGSKILVVGDMENNNHEKEKDGVLHKTYGFRFTVKSFEFLDNKKQSEEVDADEEPGKGVF